MHTIGAAASGVNASNSTAGGGGRDHQDHDGHHREQPYTVAFHVF